MLKRKVNDFHAIALTPMTQAHPGLRLANDNDRPVVSPARGLQQDIARVFAQEKTWSVRRTVAIGVAFHLSVFSALGLAAGGMIAGLPS